MPDATTKSRLRSPIFIITLVVFVVFIAWVGSWVYWAATVKPNPSIDYASQLEQLSREAQVEGENGWPDIVRAIEIYNELDEAFPPDERAAPFKGGFFFEPLFDPDYKFGKSLHFDAEEVSLAQARKELYAALSWLSEQGAWAALASAGSKPNIVKPINTNGQMLVAVDFSEIATLRALARTRATTMRLAFEAGDFQEAGSALADILTLARAAENMPIVIGSLVGDAIRALAYSYILDELQRGALNAPMLKRLFLVWSANPPPTDMVMQLEGERRNFLDIMQWCYSDDGNGDGYRIGNDSNFTSVNPSGDANVSIIDILLNAPFKPSRAAMAQKATEVFDEYVTIAGSQAIERWDQLDAVANDVESMEQSYDLIFLLMPALQRSLIVHDLARMKHDALRIMMAIEFYREVNHRVPATLDQIVPGLLMDVPTDVTNGQPFGYRVIENDEHGRDYLLYSFGRDGVDNDGACTDPNAASSAYDWETTGFDFIINTPPAARE